MQGIVDWLNDYIWSNALVYFILGTGSVLTFATRFFQFRHFKDMIRLTFKGETSKAGISSFQAVSMSIGSRAGNFESSLQSPTGTENLSANG
ncbi:hypothetical protein [Salinicoccus bachuensis]|uniref:Sodium:alanine symporter family protein n=1 Tax=Salinicoccus bachuensis TaxID=3136731 RepID=A0ABZ3CH02_9STAP